jgi:hypothetical protein
MFAVWRFPVGAEFLFRIGVLRVCLKQPDVFNGNVRVVGRVKPAAPEPIQIRSARVFHRAKKIGGHRAFEFPAARILFKCESRKVLCPKRFRAKCSSASPV